MAIKLIKIRGQKHWQIPQNCPFTYKITCLILADLSRKLSIGNVFEENCLIIGRCRLWPQPCLAIPTPTGTTVTDRSPPPAGHT